MTQDPALQDTAERIESAFRNLNAEAAKLTHLLARLRSPLFGEAYSHLVRTHLLHTNEAFAKYEALRNELKKHVQVFSR